MLVRVCDGCGAIDRKDNEVRVHNLHGDFNIIGDYCEICFDEKLEQETKEGKD